MGKNDSGEEEAQKPFQRRGPAERCGRQGPCPLTDGFGVSQVFPETLVIPV